MSEQYYHPANNLKAGDQIEVTIRHATDGKLNRHKVPVTVIENFPSAGKVFVQEGVANPKKRELIPYNDVCLTK